MNKSASYIPSLDGLRGLSILLVFIAHIGFEKIVPGGLGVTIFFFISGYIITKLLIDEYKQNSKIDIKAFFIRRLLRLYPPLLLMLLLYFTYLLCTNKHIDYYEVLAAIFYYDNYYIFYNMAGSSELCKILWSLSVEEHFYIVFPLVLMGLIKAPKVLSAVLVLLIIIPLVCRYSGALSYPAELAERYCYVLTHTRFDAIIYGCLASVMLYLYGSVAYIKILSNKLLFIAALAIQLFCLIYRDPLFRNTLRYSLQGISLFVIVPAIVNVAAYQKIKQLFSNAIMVYLGKLSYSIYLMHMIAISILNPIKANGPVALYYLSVMLLTLLLAMFSYYTVEKPLIKLRLAYSTKHLVRSKALRSLTYG